MYGSHYVMILTLYFPCLGRCALGVAVQSADLCQLLVARGTYSTKHALTNFTSNSIQGCTLICKVKGVTRELPYLNSKSAWLALASTFIIYLQIKKTAEYLEK